MFLAAWRSVSVLQSFHFGKNKLHNINLEVNTKAISRKIYVIRQVCFKFIRKKKQKENNNNVARRDFLGARTFTCSSVPGFLFADTNPKAAGIFCLLLLLASHPCRALRSTFTPPVSLNHTHAHQHTHDYGMDYKYSGKER